MKMNSPQPTLSQQAMHVMRHRLRLPVIMLMLLCNFAWSVQGFGQTISATGDGRSRVIKLNVPNAAVNLRPGMTVTGGSLTPGTYITQVLSGDHILVNLPFTTDFEGEDLTFGAVDELEDTEEARTDYTKNTADRSVVFGKNALTGTITINQGSLQIGGVASNGRLWMQDLIDDGAAVRMANDVATVLDFASNDAPYRLFERIGSLGTTGDTGSLATVNLTGGSTNTALAVGSDNSDTTFRGNITGDIDSRLIKEGDGTMIWQSDYTNAMRGTIRVESGTLVVTGANGLNPLVDIAAQVNLSLSNKAGASLYLNAAPSQQRFNSLSGGGRGAITTFSNGVLGALSGNYLGATGGEVNIAAGKQLVLEGPNNAIFAYGGSITGGGDLVKNGGNVLELLGENSYAGFTSIQFADANNTQSVLRLGAYGTSSGVGTLESGGFGQLPSTTSLRLLSGTGLNRDVIFELNGATQTLSSLQSNANPGARTVILDSGTININTVGNDVSGVFQGTFEGRGVINVLATLGNELNPFSWELTGDSNSTQSGSFNILGGQVTLKNAATGTLGDRVHVTVMGDGILNVAESDTVGSLSGNGRVEVAAGRTLTLTTGPQGGAMANAWSGEIDGLGGLTLNTGASIRLTTAQNYLGNTTVRSGSILHLDYGSGETGPKLIEGPMNLNGGSLFLSGNSGQTISSVTLGVGASRIVAPLDSPDAKLNFSTITRDADGGGVLQVYGNTLTTSAALLPSGIMGGYMTHHTVDSLTGKPQVSWATKDVDNQIISLGSYAAAFGSGLNTDVTTANTLEVLGGGLVGSLRFNQAGAVNLSYNAAMTVQSGGILVTPNVGSNNLVISSPNGMGLSGGSGGGDFNVTNELIIHQHNTRGKLTIEAPIVNASGASRLTKTGQGTLVLTHVNSYSGQTSILGGVLELADSVINPLERGNLGNSSAAIQNFGYLVANRTGNLNVTNSITGSGSIRLIKAAGGLTLTGGQSDYTGSTTVVAGTLGVGSMSALGSVAGQTSVSAAGILQLRNITTAEPIQLKGGKLSSVVGQSTLTGTLTVTSSSTLTAPDSTSQVPFIISGRIHTLPGQTLSLLTENTVGTAGLGGKFILTNDANKIGDIILGAKTTLQIGLQNVTSGSVGRGTITTGAGSNVIVTSNSDNLVFGAKITGGASFYVSRGTTGTGAGAPRVILTADNDYTGKTIVGAGEQSEALGLLRQGGSLTIGNDTYTGSIGTGDLIVKSGEAAGVNISFVRYNVLKSGEITNNIMLNPGVDGVTARNVNLVQNGLGSLDFTGVITAGNHGEGGQRALLQTILGTGKVTLSNRINNGEFNRLNISNAGFMAFNNPDPMYNQMLWGVLSANGAYTFRSAGSITLKGQNTFNTNHYVKSGILLVDNADGLGLHDDVDMYLTRGGQLHFNYTETLGTILSQEGSLIRINNGSTITMDDGGVYANHGRITGEGTLQIAPTATAWVGLFGDNELTTNMIIGSGALTTVRINNLANSGVVSSLGMGDAINLGSATAGGETRLEYIGLGGAAQATDRTINLMGNSGTVRIAGSGKSGMILNGNIMSNGNRTLFLHGQTTGNTINGAIMEGSGTLALNVNTNALANNDMYGSSGYWKLTNAASDFSGNVNVQLGTLELAGSLGNGTGTSSVLGDLTTTRLISMGANSYDNRRFDLFTGVDSAIPANIVANQTGTILFNDMEEGTAVLGSNISFIQPFSSTTNPGSAEFINNGNKVIVIQGQLQSGASGNRNWILDGTNTGVNTISGIIRDPSSGNTAGILKEGTGRWRLSGANQYEGATQVARGILEISGGLAIWDNGTINLTNAGSDGSAEGGATLRVLDSETIGVLMGAYGTTVELLNGSILTVRAGTQVYNGVITGNGGIVRTNNDGNARNMILTNLNTYTGSTTITKTGANTGATGIFVHTLANGGQASSIGASSSAASNLILNTNDTAGGLRWMGTFDQSTDRLFTMGAGTNAIYAAGQVFGDSTPALHWTNTGAIEFLQPNTNHTLVLGGATIANNTFAPQINDNGTGVTSLTKLDAGIWVLTNENNYSGGTSIANGVLAISHGGALGSGDVTIAGGSTRGLQLRGGITVHNNLTHTVSETALGSLTGDNVFAGDITLVTGNFRLAVSPGSSLNVTGDIVGTSSNLIKQDQGTLILSGNNNYTGATLLGGGTVVLNFNAANGGTDTSKLNNVSALTLGFYNTTGSVGQLGESPDVSYLSNQVAFGGTTLVLSGGTHTEIVSATTLGNGANRIIRDGGTSTLEMRAITRSAANAVNNYGTIDFSESGIATTITQSTTAVGGILATTGTSTTNSAYATVGQTTWAVTGTSGTSFVTGLNTYANNGFGTTAANGIINSDIVSNFTTSTIAFANTLRFNSSTGPTTLTLGGSSAGSLGLVAGGILVTKNVTDDVLITGPAGSFISRSQTTANLDTVFHHYGEGLLTLDVILANNSTGAQALTKTGPGTMVMTKANTFTGRVNIQQGVLQIGNGATSTANARLGGLATGNLVTLSEGATLRYAVANPGAEHLLGALTGGGMLHLASTNQATITLASANSNWMGDILVEGGTLRVRSDANALGSIRNYAVIGTGGTLDFQMVGAALTFTKRLTLQDGAKLTVTNAGEPTNTITTLSGVITIENTDPSKKASFDVSAGQILTLSSLIRSTNGFTKLGDGLMNMTANMFDESVEGAVTTTAGAVTPNANPTLLGQVIVAGGELRLGYIALNVGRSLGATGVGNETIVQNGAALNLFGQSLNYGNDADPFREIIHISGSGSDGLGALRNSNGLGGVSTVIFDGSATMSGGGFFNGQVGVTASATVTGGSRLVVSGYDINPNSTTLTGVAGAVSEGLAGNYERVEAVIDGRGANLTIVGNSTFADSTGAGVTFRDVNFISALNSIIISEGVFRIDQEAGKTATFQGLTSAQVTNGVRIAYAGPTLADHTNASLGVGPNVGARLNFFRNFGTTHSANIIMDGVLAKANAGANYIDLGTDATIPNPRTYLSGSISLLGDADRNFFHIDAATLRETVAEQGNLTGTIQSKLIVNGQIVGSGGFTKTGLQELRLTGNNSFTGVMNVLSFGAVSVPWQDNLVTIGTNSYQTLGDAEGWSEWGVTLSGQNGRLSGTSAINLQRRGLLTLDNTNRLDATSLVVGGNNNNRINDAASINFDQGWLKIIGGTVDNTESLATMGGAKINVRSGTNTIDLMPTDGANTKMVLTIGEITRSAGSVLQFNNLDSTSKFGTGPGLGIDAGPESVQILLNDIGTLTEVGLGAGLTDKKIVVGFFGGIMPHEYLSDIRQLAYNNGNFSDYLTQGRVQQAIAATQFMTYDSVSKVLRPLDDSEYFVPGNGLLDTGANGGAGQNVNLLETVSIVRDNMSINSLRFGPLSDTLGNNVGENAPINSTTTLTSLVDAHSLQLLVDGRLTISSGMISSAYFTTGNNSIATNNTGAFDTLIAGGILNFGSREAIINNQNAVIRATDGTVTLGNLEIRSVIQGSGGLLKTGLSPVFLDGRNTYTGVTTVSNGTLFLRNGRHALGAGGAGNGVVIEGNGSLSSGGGIQVGSPTAYENILVKALQADQYVMRVDNDLTNWFSNLTVDNVDHAGQVQFTPVVRLDGASSAIFNGNFYGSNTAVSQDVVANDPRSLRFETASDSTMIFRGQFGDKSDAQGNAVPISHAISTLQTLEGVRTNENEVLTVRLAGGSAETNFIMEQQYNAVGRLTLFQGNLQITYDPNDPNRDGNGFWTDAAISKMPGANSNTVINAASYAQTGGSLHHGFIMDSNAYGAANTGGAALASGVSSLLLTRAGQVFNMGSWSAIGGGVKWIGGTNESGTVYFGTPENTGNLTIVGAAVRFYSMAGGTVEFDQRIEGNVGTAPNNPGFIKVGRGTVILKNSTNAATTPVTSNFEIAGGTLVLDHNGVNTARVGTQNAFLGGGVVYALGNDSADSTVGYAFTTSTTLANSVLNLRVGSNTELIAEGRGGNTMTVNVGNGSSNSNRSNLTRAAGSSINFVESTGGIINFNFNSLAPSAVKGELIPWATYGTAPRQALDFAVADVTTNRVSAVARSAGDFVNNVQNWTPFGNMSESGTGFFGTLANDVVLNTLRFDSATSGGVNIAGNRLFSLNGGGVTGGILVSSNTGSADKFINGGYLMAYDQGSFSGSLTQGSNVIMGVNAPALGLTPGLPIAGSGIPDGATITAVDTVANTVTISANATLTSDFTILTTFVTSYTVVPFTGTTTAPSNAVDSEGNPVVYEVDPARIVTNVSNVGALAVGMRVTGEGISDGSEITEISGNTITLSLAATAGKTNANLGYFVGGTLAGSDVIRNIPSHVVLEVGKPISGQGIPLGAFIESFTANTITMSVAATSTVPAIRLSTSTPDIMVHQYGQGTLTIGSTITGNSSLTIAGPMTTSPEQFGTTGVVKLTGNNTYSGVTTISGSVLEISTASALGLNPDAPVNGHIIMNGGTLRWTGGVESLGNRGITFNGSGGVIDVVNATANLFIGDGISGTQASIVSGEIFRGDLIKMGAGSLTLTGNNATFQSLIDVREGTLILMVDNGNAGAGTITPMGTTRSLLDGTIMRTGTDLQIFLGNGSNAGDWNIDEHITFEGGNTFTYGGLIDVSTNVAPELPVYNLGNRRPLNMNGTLSVQGTTTINVIANGILRLSNNSGYVTGSGDIIKDGQGQLHFRANNPDWTGGMEIKQGTVMVANQADALGTGYLSGKTITLGSTDRQDAAELLVQLVDTTIQGWLFEVNHDIEVVYNPAQTKRIGIDSTSNATLVNYNGDIILNDNLVLLMRDIVTAVGGEQSYVNFNGNFRDGAVTSGNLLVQTDDNNTVANDRVQGRSYGYAVLNGDNSGWTGDITISNNAVYNQDTTAILRLGSSKALTAANDVRMNYNSILQAGGRNVTMGNLSTFGGDGAFYGDAGTMSSNLNSSSEIIENASTRAANLTFTQTTPATYEAAWDAYFRDGTINSDFFAPGANILQPSAALSITKAGNGWATLTLDNDYSGATVVQQGVLQVGRNGIGDTGATPTAGNAATLMTRVLAGGTLAGTGTVQGRLTVLAGGTLKTGDSAGAEIGTLFVSGNAIFASGANALMQVRTASYNNPGALTASDEQYAFWRNGVINDSFSSALTDLVTTSQHDMLRATGTINWAPGTKITLESEGYTPKAGDIIRLFSATSFVGEINVGPDLRTGTEAIANLDLILFALGGNLLWDVSYFNSHGFLMVVEADVAIESVPPPVITVMPQSNQSQTEQLPPGTMVTLTAEATTTGDPSRLRYQWIRNGIPVPGGNTRVFTFEVNFNSKGTYTVAATNEGGTTLSPDEFAVTVLVEDVPDITFDTTTVNKLPGSTHIFDISVGGQEPFEYQWLKNGEPIDDATEKQLILTDLAESDQGYYSVIVTNEAGMDTSGQAFLNVLNPITSVVVAKNPEVVYLGQTVLFTSTVVGDGPFTYQWKKGTANINGATGPTFTIGTANAGSAGNYTVVVTSAVNTAVSNVVTVTMNEPAPAILDAPDSLTLLSGDPLTISVDAAGLPVLRYVWRKDNKVLSTDALDTIYRESATLSDGGTYTVEVINSKGRVNTAKDDAFTPAEIVVVDSGSQYLAVAPMSTATLKARVGLGRKTQGVSYQWNRVLTREVVIPGDGGGDGDDGEGDGDGDGDGDDNGDTIVIEEYLEPVANGGRFSGANTAELKIASVAQGLYTGVTGDEGLYRLEVTGPDGTSVVGSEYDLRVFTAAPEFTGPLVFDNALIGRDYTFQVPVNRADREKTPEKITATGLPPGLSIDPFSGLITGRPSATKAGGYKVRVTLANKQGKVTLEGQLIVDDLLPTVTGVWVGLFERDLSLADDLGGRLDLTVTSKATFSGKLLLGGNTYSIKGPLDLDDSQPALPSGRVFIRRPGNPLPPPLELAFTLNPTENTIASATVTDGTNTLDLTHGWRMTYSKAEPASTYTGYYTMALGLGDDSPLLAPIGAIPGDPEGSPHVPLGAGFATFTVAVDGKLKMTGKMPDGETLTNATFIGPDGQIAIYQHMYKRIKSTGFFASPNGGIIQDTARKAAGGSLLGVVTIDDQGDADPQNSNNTLSGNATWVRPANPNVKERAFKQGFGVGTAEVVKTPVELMAVGGRYDAPAAGQVVLGMPEATDVLVPNARIEFFNGGDLNWGYTVEILETSFVSQDPSVNVVVAKNSKVIVPKATQPPEVKTTVRAVAKRGLVSGTFVVVDFNPRYPLRPYYVKRSVKFQGVIINEPLSGGGSQQVGVGYFLLPQLPNALIVPRTTDKTSPIYSGRFLFEPLSAPLP